MWEVQRFERKLIASRQKCYIMFQQVTTCDEEI